MPNPTERLPDESVPAYQAFKTYLEMGPNRSTREVGRTLGKSSALIYRWSSKYRWVERCRELDNHLEKITREAEEAKLIMDAGTWAKRMQEARESAFQAANKLIEKAEAMLKFPLAEQKSQDGKTIIKPGRWTFGDAARMLETASRLKQLSTGLPTERFEHAGPEGQPLPAAAPQVVFYMPSNGRDDTPESQ